MREVLKRGRSPVPQEAGLVRTNILVIGVSKIGDGSVIGKANNRKATPRSSCDPVWRIGDPIKSDPWKRINPT